MKKIKLSRILGIIIVLSLLEMCLYLFHTSLNEEIKIKCMFYVLSAMGILFGGTITKSSIKEIKKTKESE